MIFQVDFQAGKPVYLQLADQIRYAAASGRLRPGDPLPSLRPLAEELRINRNTIARAYAELEAQGIIETLPGKGYFLKDNHSALTQQTRQRLLQTEIDEAVVMAHHLRVDREKFLALVAGPARLLREQSLRRQRRQIKQNPNDMKTETPVIEIKNLSRRYGHLEAVNGLNITVQPGRCYGFFGRNGAGKTTTIKCLLNLLQPTSGTARVFGLDPQRQEVAVKSRLSYVPDSVAFYPWMTVDETLQFHRRVPAALESGDGGGFARTGSNSTAARRRAISPRGRKRNWRLIGAVCPEPELLVLGRTDLGAGPDRAPRIHPDGHRRLSRRRSRTPHGFCLDAPDRRI